MIKGKESVLKRSNQKMGYKNQFLGMLSMTLMMVVREMVTLPRIGLKRVKNYLMSCTRTFKSSTTDIDLVMTVTSKILNIQIH